MHALLNGTNQAAGSPAYFYDSEAEIDDGSADEAPVQADGRPANPRLPKRTRTEPPASSQPGTSAGTLSDAADADQRAAQRQSSVALSEQQPSASPVPSWSTPAAHVDDTPAASARGTREEGSLQQRPSQQDETPVDSRDDSLLIPPPQVTMEAAVSAMLLVPKPVHALHASHVQQAA